MNKRAGRPPCSVRVNFRDRARSFTVDQVAHLLGVHRRRLRRGPLPWFKQRLHPGGMAKLMVGWADLFAHCLRLRHDGALRRLGWEPCALLLAGAHGLAGEVRDRCAPLEVLYASDLYTAGVLVGRRLPCSLAIDMPRDMADGAARLAALHAVRKAHPQVRLIALWPDGAAPEVVRQAADVVVAPRGKAVADAIMEGWAETSMFKEASRC
jgi:hypothetical protein